MQSTQIKNLSHLLVFQILTSFLQIKSEKIYRLAILNNNKMLQEAYWKNLMKKIKPNTKMNQTQIAWNLLRYTVNKLVLKKFIVIDTNNIFYTKNDQVSFHNFKKHYKMSKRIQKKRNEIQFLFICDRSIMKKIDQPDKFTNLYLEKSNIIISDWNIEADLLILECSEKLQKYFDVLILSQDKFRDYESLYNSSELNRIKVKNYKKNPYRCIIDI